MKMFYNMETLQCKHSWAINDNFSDHIIVNVSGMMKKRQYLDLT